MNDDIAALLALEQRRQQALICADVSALRALLAEDLTHIHSTGLVHTKAQFIQHIQTMGGFANISRAEPEVQVYGDIALLTGATRNTVRLLDSGQEAVREGFSTLIARRTATGWEILLSQLTPFKERRKA